MKAASETPNYLYILACLHICGRVKLNTLKQVYTTQVAHGKYQSMADKTYSNTERTKPQNLFIWAPTYFTDYTSYTLCHGQLEHIHTHTHPFNGPFPGLPRWASTRKVKPIWILLKQETVSGSDIRWAIMGNMQVCTALQTDNHDSTLPLSFYRLDALTTAEPTASKHWRHTLDTYSWLIIIFDAEERHFKDCFGHTGCP